MVSPQSGADIVEQCQIAIGEDCVPVAILPQGMGIVGHENNIGAQHAVAERVGTSPAKALVANLGHFVDQVDIKVDGE